MAGENDPTYKDCRLEILDESHIKYSDDYQQQAVGEVLKDELIRDTIERFVYWIDKYGDPAEQMCTGDDLNILGLHLYNLLFDSEARENPETQQRLSIRYCFERAYKNFEIDRENNTNLRLRVILTFHPEADSLAAYPWEFIRVPHQPKNFFLAGKQTELILTRCVPAAGIKDRLDPEERPLKILIACCSPHDLPKVAADGVIKYIEGLRKPRTIEVDTVTNPTFSNIEAKLNEMKPHIFHFIGHGRASPNNKPEIALMKEPDEIAKAEMLQSPAEKRAGIKVPHSAWIESEIFAQLFKRHRPRLVFLHACKGAAPGYKFHNTASDLVKAKIPAVVAMQFEISNDDANAFAQKFYEYIDAGGSVDEAVSEGRWELGTFPYTRGAWNDRGFGTPVIYLQSKGAVISPRPREAAGNNKGGEEGSVRTKEPCPYADCKDGLVVRGRGFCGKCRRQITVCPKCDSIMAIGFCDNCGYSGEARRQDVSSAAAVSTPESQLQQSAGAKDHLPASAAESGEAKSSSIDVRAELVQ